jgi:hypothetical protein
MSASSNSFRIFSSFFVLRPSCIVQHEGAICFMALICLILVLGERRRRSRAQGSGLNLSRTQTLDAYPITHPSPSPSPGLGLGLTQNQNEKTSGTKSSRFGGWLAKLGMGKRRGGVCDPARDEQQAHRSNSFLYPPPQLQNSGDDRLHLLQRDDGNSQLLDPASIPIPEGPPPVYTDGICEKGRHIEAQEPFKYDPVRSHSLRRCLFFFVPDSDCGHRH